MKGYYITFESKGNAVLKECEVPQPANDEVLMDTDYSVVSPGTELSNLMQLPNTVTAANGFPHESGYSAAGRVIAVGKDVTDLKIGDRTIIARAGHRSHVIKKADTVLKIEDDSIDLLDAAMARIAVFSFLGVKKLKIELGESVMVAGMGLLGAFALQIATLSGAIPVLVSDFNQARRELALKLGAAAAFSPTEENFIKKVKAVTGGDGPNAVVEVTGSSAALQQALEYIAWNGRISLLGCTRTSDTPIDFYKYIHKRGISLIGAHNFTRAKKESDFGDLFEHDDFRTFLKLVSAGKMQAKSLLSEVVSPEKAHEIYAQLAENKNPPLGFAFDWSKLK